MDKEILAKFHSSRPQKLRKLSDESSHCNGANNLLEETSMEAVPARDFTSEALSNFEVLENIFRYLDGEDLERCKIVNQRWKFVLGQIYPQHYEVIIKAARKHPIPGCEKNIIDQNHVTIQKLGWSSKRSDKKKFSFQNAVTLLLEESSKERKFVIDIGIEIPKCSEDAAVEDFLSKIGHLVREFTPYSRKEFLDPLCRLAHRHFPTLCYLNLSHAAVRFLGGSSWEDYKDYLKENAFKNLRKISFGESLDHFEIAESFVRSRLNKTSLFIKVDHSLKVAESLINMAPNLKEIHEFPVHLVDALISTGKINLVKSICYPQTLLVGEQPEPDFPEDAFNEGRILDGGPLEDAFKKIAQLEPKLISFSSYLHEGSAGSYLPDYLNRDCVKPYVCQILQSSYQSLETLTVHSSDSFDFREISPITSLKKIRFISHEYKRNELELLTSNFNPERNFPNVTAVEIVKCVFTAIDDHVSPRPLSPWGSKVKELVLKGGFHLNSNTIQSMADTFPSLKTFKILGFFGGVAPDAFTWIFPLIADLWPDIEALSIKMKDERPTFLGYQGYSFDSLFTGIPKKLLTMMKTPTGRNKIPKKKVEAFYANSTIRKLSNLKKLEFEFYYFSVGARQKFLDKLSRITCLSKEFGFDFLAPGFKILVRETGSNSVFKVKRDLKKIQEDLSSVVELEFETIIQNNDSLLNYF